MSTRRSRGRGEAASSLSICADQAASDNRAQFVQSSSKHRQSRPDDVQHVLQQNYKNYQKAKTYETLRPLVGNGLLTVEPEKARSHHRFAFFPFGGGPRKCVGGDFATMEATLALAKILRRFELTYVGEVPAALEGGVTLRPRHPMPMRLARR